MHKIKVRYLCFVWFGPVSEPKAGPEQLLPGPGEAGMEGALSSAGTSYGSPSECRPGR